MACPGKNCQHSEVAAGEGILQRREGEAARSSDEAILRTLPQAILLLIGRLRCGVRRHGERGECDDGGGST